MTNFRVSSGDFFKPVPGWYIGQFKGTKPGTGYKAAGKVDPNNVWSFALWGLDQQPIIDPRNGGQGIGEGLSGASLGFGKDGDPAKGRVWLSALCASKGVVLPRELPQDQVPAYFAQAQDAIVYVEFALNPKDATKVFLKTVQVDAPQVQTFAPVQPAPVAVAPVALPAMAPALAAVAAAPSLPAMPVMSTAAAAPAAVPAPAPVPAAPVMPMPFPTPTA